MEYYHTHKANYVRLPRNDGQVLIEHYRHDIMILYYNTFDVNGIKC